MSGEGAFMANSGRGTRGLESELCQGGGIYMKKERDAL